MSRLHLVATNRVDIQPAGCPLTDEIRRAGRKMERAMAAGQRDLAGVWMRCMYDLIGLRNRSVQKPSDIQGGGHA
jgi:hypothetical protein